MIARLILPLLLLSPLIAGQSEEFRRLKQELDDRIAKLRPEAREVAQRLQAVFEARLPKDEAKARLNAVLETASDTAKAALDTLKPDHKIDVELVVPLPEPTSNDDGEADRILDRLMVPGLDRITTAVDRLNLTEKTLAEAFRVPNLAAQIGVDKNALVKIENLAAERGLSNYTVDYVLQTLRYNVSLLLNNEERSCLEKYAYGKNITSLEQLFDGRLGGGPRPDPRDGIDRAIGGIRNATDGFIGGIGGPRPIPPPRDGIDRAIGGLRNATDGFIGGGRNHSGEFIDKFLNGSDGKFVDKIKERFGNDSSLLDFPGLSNVSDKSIQQLLAGLKAGNSSVVDRFFNGTGNSGNGTLTKIKEAFKNGNLAAILGSGSNNGTSIVEKLKSMFNITLPASGGSDSSTGTIGSLIKDFFG